ncbi:MAG: hypothetical protein ACPGWR_33255, partial [Ardenticatenaceae bacterium]
AKIFITLVQNTEATVLGRNQDSTWIQIEITDPSVVGWTSASPQFVTISGDIAELPIIEIE